MWERWQNRRARRAVAKALRHVNRHLRSADRDLRRDLLCLSSVLPAWACWPRR